jgi:hypothetical protein
MDQQHLAGVQFEENVLPTPVKRLDPGVAKFLLECGRRRRSEQAWEF